MMIACGGGGGVSVAWITATVSDGQRDYSALSLGYTK